MRGKRTRELLDREMYSMGDPESERGRRKKDPMHSEATGMESMPT